MYTPLYVTHASFHTRHFYARQFLYTVIAVPLHPDARSVPDGPCCLRSGDQPMSSVGPWTHFWEWDTADRYARLAALSFDSSAEQGAPACIQNMDTARASARMWDECSFTDVNPYAIRCGKKRLMFFIIYLWLYSVLFYYV